jgi:hypothetical protein
MREGQSRLAEQERAAAAELMEKRQRRDSARDCGSPLQDARRDSGHGHMDGQLGLNLTSPKSPAGTVVHGGMHLPNPHGIMNHLRHQPHRDLDDRDHHSSVPSAPPAVHSRGARARSESPTSAASNSPIPPIDDDDDDVITDEETDRVPNQSGACGDSPKNKEDKVNNNDDRQQQQLQQQQQQTQSPATLLGGLAGLPAGLAGLEGLAAAAAAANGGGETHLSSVYGLIGNIQALLKMAVENAKQEERQNILKCKY